MNIRSTHFFGQPVFGQLISLIDKKIIIDSVHECQSEYNVFDYFTNNDMTHKHIPELLFPVIVQFN